MNKKSLLVFIALTLVFALLITGCGGGTQESGPAPSEDTSGESEEDAAADDPFPERPITIMVGFNPGGGMDIMSRALAGPMSEYLGVDVSVVNMSGAGSAIAADYVNQQPADGYMLFAVSSATSTFPATGYTDITYNEFQLVNIPMAASPTFSVPVNSPYETMDDLVEAIKAGGTKASNSGIGGIWHIPQELLVAEVGGSADFVPYEGGAPAAQAVAQGDVTWGTHDAIEGKEYFMQGFSRPLAVFASEPFELSDWGSIPPITDFVPELADVIIPGSGWRGMGIKQGVPAHRLEKIYEAIEYAVTSQEFIDFAKANDTLILDVRRDEAQAIWEQTTKIQSWLMYDLGIAERSPEEVNIPRP